MRMEIVPKINVKIKVVIGWKIKSKIKIPEKIIAGIKPQSKLGLIFLALYNSLYIQELLNFVS